jgi:hypothetical protein
MGSSVSTALGRTAAASIIDQPPLQVSGTISKKTHSCSSNDFPASTQQPRTISKSLPVNPLQHSLVNIAPELRNNIYAQLLLIGGPVILAPQKRIIAPGLVLPRKCKQIHDEAASFFYEANSFQCYILKLIPVQCASEGSIQCPNLTSFISPTTLLDPLAIHGGIFFPAQRYHQYLTRLTIGVKASFRTFDMTISSRPLLRLPSGNLDTTRANVGKTQQAM